MRATRYLGCLCALVMLGCASEKVDLGDAVEESDAAKADFFSRRVDVRATLGYGETVDGSFADTGFSGYTFAGAAGARIDIDLAGDGNDPVLYVYGPMIGDGWGRARRVARNDDGGPGRDSHLDFLLPSDGTFLILAREYYGRGGDFALSLACEGDECRPACRADAACPTGAICERIYCITSPCPSFCAPEPIETACGSRGSAACAAGQFCEYEDGDDCGRADRAGTCSAQPTACTREYRPVCGCDGNTYGNRCGAHAAGVSVDYDGTCAPSGACTETECGPRPLGEHYLCDDGVTTAGIGDCTRAEDGTCGWETIECPAPRFCETLLGGRCEDGEFCATTGPNCGRADEGGACAPIPTVCTREFLPVCGCDGRTYANRCNANAAGVSVAAEGACEEPCRIAGCNSELCVGPGDPGFSICLAQPDAVCYEGATCERQSDGACGWTETPDLRSCLDSF